jgi:acetoacetate decarboxylase
MPSPTFGLSSPGGVSSVVGDLPWHYATEYLTIAYRTDPAAIAAYLPEPLAPGPEPDLAYVAFSRWWSLWDNQPEMAFTNPERTQYRECAICVGYLPLVRIETQRPGPL